MGQWGSPSSWVGPIGLALVLGCGTPTTVTPDAGAPRPDAGPPPLAISGTVALGTGDRLAGVDVCIEDMPEVPCSVTNALGNFEIVGAPRNAEIVLRIADGDPAFVAHRVLIRTGEVSDYVGSYLAYTTSSVSTALGASTWDAATSGIVLVDFRTGGFLLPYGWSPDALLGASITSSHGGDVVYPDENLVVDPRLSATSAAGVVLVLNVPPGEDVLTAVHPGAECVVDAAQAWPGPSADTVRVDVRAGAITTGALFHCVPHG